MKTLHPKDITAADRPFMAARGNADGTVTLYYPGDAVPALTQTGAPNCPASVTNRQFRLALTHAGLRAAAEAYVTAGSQDLKDWWAYEQDIQRQHPLILAAMAALGVTDAQADAVFSLAQTL